MPLDVPPLPDDAPAPPPWSQPDEGDEPPGPYAPAAIAAALAACTAGAGTPSRETATEEAAEGKKEITEGGEMGLASPVATNECAQVWLYGRWLLLCAALGPSLPRRLGLLRRG